MKKPPRNELENRIPYNERRDLDTWTIIVKIKGRINMQDPRKKKRRNLAFLLTDFPYDCSSN